MSNYEIDKKIRLRRLPHRVWSVVIVFIVLIVGGAIIANLVYRAELKPVSRVQKTVIFTVLPGTSVTQIANQLSNAHLIRSSWATQLYIHSKNLSSKLQAGTYAFSPSESTGDIITTLSKGQVTSNLVTILPGRRIDQIRADFINDGFKPAAVDAALQPAQYSDLAVLAFKPANVNTLEGLLWPDSFERVATTDPSVIIRESLAEMGQQLTSQVQAAFASEGLTTYQGITLASVIQQEVSKPADQAQAAQVFLSRLKLNMPLGSDVTANYGAIAAGRAPSLSFDSPYNTLLHTGVPPTPISTISANSLSAVTHPAATNWLYFVTGDDGTTYFSTNLADQQSNTAKYCHKLCSQP